MLIIFLSSTVQSKEYAWVASHMLFALNFAIVFFSIYVSRAEQASFMNNQVFLIKRNVNIPPFQKAHRLINSAFCFRLNCFVTEERVKQNVCNTNVNLFQYTIYLVSHAIQTDTVYSKKSICNTKLFLILLRTNFLVLFANFRLF